MFHWIEAFYGTIRSHCTVGYLSPLTAGDLVLGESVGEAGGDVLGFVVSGLHRRETCGGL